MQKRAFQLIKNQLTPQGVNKDENSGGGTYPNLFDAHPPFQIDGNFGCTAGIAEMLMQSYDGSIYLLPALPDAWTEGEISGLRTQGGFEISNMKWKNGQLLQLSITSTIGGNCRLRLSSGMKMKTGTALKIANGENKNPFFAVPSIPNPIISPKATRTTPVVKETKLYDIETLPGKTYILIADK